MSVVVVAGAIANKPGNGGEAWVRLSWIRALEQLGFTVYLLEELASRACVDGAGAQVDVEDSVNLDFFRDVVRQFDLEDRATLLVDDERRYGATALDLEDVAEDALLLVNISGHLRRPNLLKCFRRKAYVDIDPGFTQYWHATSTGPLGLQDHDAFFTVGENIGSPGCDIPTGGIPWTPVRQPVALDDWPVVAVPTPERLTTVARWRSLFGPVEDNGRTYRLKVHEFRRFIDLPERVSPRLEVALDIDPADGADRRLLLERGWHLADPVRAAGDPHRFRAYVQGSGGEFSVAQGVYVATASGWFSDRTVRYLASGKPALVQETGFSRNLETGLGLVPFSTPDEAVAGAASIAAHYDEHCEAARGIAERDFAAEVVLPPLLERAGVKA